MIQAFVDDSGGKGSTRHFVLVSLISTSESWASFSDEWRACLKEYPAVTVFKMKEAAGLSGRFYGVSAANRDRKLRRLAQIINRYARIVTHSMIDLEAHSLTWANLPKPRNDPYFWTFQCTILAACFALWDAGLRERFEIVFDEQVICGPRAKLWYPVIKSIMEHREPEAASILPEAPRFQTDDDALPIQAADLFAWCMRKATDDKSFTTFEWLLEELSSVKQTDYSQYYDLERMSAVQTESIRLAREGLVPDTVQKAAQETRRLMQRPKT